MDAQPVFIGHETGLSGEVLSVSALRHLLRTLILFPLPIAIIRHFPSTILFLLRLPFTPHGSHCTAHASGFIAYVPIMMGAEQTE